MSVIHWAEPTLDPPPEPRSTECDACGAEVAHWAELYDLHGGELCLDCAAEYAIETIAGIPRLIQEEELQLCFAAIEHWLSARKSDLLAESAVALRAAIRAQRRSRS